MNSKLKDALIAYGKGDKSAFVEARRKIDERNARLEIIGHEQQGIINIPPTPPASTESKSLGEILADECRSVQMDVYGRSDDTWDKLSEQEKKNAERCAQAVASSVSLRYKGEIEELKAQNARLWNAKAGFSDLCLSQEQEVEELKEMLQQKVWPHETEVPMRAEISRLTTLCNENAVLAVEREAENVRKDAMIEEANIALSDLAKWMELYIKAECAPLGEMWITLASRNAAELSTKKAKDILARLTQKGKS